MRLGRPAENWVGLLGDVDGFRRGRQRECVRLLQELTPHLHAARAVERELDRQLARRFNIFRYLRRDALGLSRIIADLLDPIAEHGQGTTFLESMLELLEVAPEVHDSARPQRALSGRRNRVATCKGLLPATPEQPDGLGRPVVDQKVSVAIGVDVVQSNGVRVRRHVNAEPRVGHVRALQANRPVQLCLRPPNPANLAR